MNNWAPLWSGLVDSSIWEEEDHVFRVFMAMMSLKDANHVVSMDGYRLSKRIHMDLVKVEDALRVLSQPDIRRPGQEHEGRRIRKVEDGWGIINGEYYRQLVREEMKRLRNRRAQQAHRERMRQKQGRTQPQAGEQAYEKALENGASEAELDKIVESSLPEKKREGYDIAKVKVEELPPSFVEDIKPALQKAEAWESETFTVLRPEGTPELKRVLHKIEPVSISSSSNEAAKTDTQPEVVNEVALSQEEDERPWHFENGKKVYDRPD